MQDKNKPAATTEKTLGFLMAETLVNLEECYITLNPEMKGEDFIKEFITPIISLEIATGDVILEEMNTRYKEVQENGTPGSFKNGPLLISTAYCLQAGKQLNLNNREFAWAYMAQAKYWHGVVRAALGIEVARTKTIHATRSATARKGAEGRTQQYVVVKEEAFRLVREMAPGGGLWQSAAQAALTIKDRVLKFAIDKGRPLATSSPEDRIAEWLGEMPDAAELFKTFKNKKG